MGKVLSIWVLLPRKSGKGFDKWRITRPIKGGNFVKVKVFGGYSEAEIITPDNPQYKEFAKDWREAEQEVW